jgi:hypothetical protein
MGESSGYWNIWEDKELTKEWMVSIPTKWQAIERSNAINKHIT